jgi:transcriptional regulator with XRE-family HTH domain
MPQPPGDFGSNNSALTLFGSQLRRHRERAGLSQERLAAKVGYAGGYIGNVERGERRCERGFAVAADRALDTHDALTELWDRTVEASAFPWWFVDWPVYERRSMLLRSFELSIVYGLLQTPDYARALLGGDEAAVEARLARQKILTPEEGSPPLVVCVLDEAVLHRRIGSPAVMRDQLEHLVEMSSDRVSVHIVRSDGREVPPGSFVLATLDDRREIAYLDTAARGLNMGGPDDLRTLSESFEMIRNRALSRDQSIELITRTAEERWT